MMLRRTHACRLSRLLVGVFAVQVLFTGFCLSVGPAHAMPMASMPGHVHVDLVGDMAEHCALGMQDMGHRSKGHAGGCFHCDEPGQYVQTAAVDLPPPGLMPAGIAILPEHVELSPVDVLPEVQDISGPPGSFSLILTTTRRIRV
jgi:hypothetical protein